MFTTCRRALGLLAFVFALGFMSEAKAQQLAAPQNVKACSSADGLLISVDWDDVTGATKYSVELTANYATGTDGVVDLIKFFDFGTSDRTDGKSISASDLTIAISALRLEVNGTSFDPVAVIVRVKALSSGPGKVIKSEDKLISDKGGVRQDNPFSDPVTVTPCR